MLAIFAGVRGYLDNIDVGKVGAFERQLVSQVKSGEPGILTAIREQKEIKPDTEKSLIAFLDKFAKSFA